MKCAKLYVVTFVATLVVAACSSDAETTGSVECAEGEGRNLAGECVPLPNGDEDDSGTSQTADAESSADARNDSTEADLGDSADVGDEPVDSGASDMGSEPARFVRFVAIGDTGTGSETQARVGQSIGDVCGQLGGCDFGMLLGDNVYDSGVSSVDDALFQSMFVVPYGHLDFPWYVVLGNHDLGGDGLGVDLDFDKADYQIGYSAMNPKWVMPDKFYQVDKDPVWMVGLNTTDAFFSQDDDQRDTLPGWLANAPTDRWRVAFGHHPYISNGRHGNAGEYEGLPFVPIANGEGVKRFIEDHVCGKFDVYLSGHDHNRQDLGEKCGTTFIVSGAGAKTTEIKDRGNDTHFEIDTEGFAVLEVTPTTFKVAFYDELGTLEHERTITR